MHMQVRGAGSKSGTLEKAAQEAHAVRTLAEVTYQDERFRVPPGFLSTPQGALSGAFLRMLASLCKGKPPGFLGKENGVSHEDKTRLRQTCVNHRA